MGALNLAGDMAGVNGVLSGAMRQDLYSGSPLSGAEANAELALGIASIAALAAGSLAKGFKASGVKGRAPSGALAKLSGTADDAARLGKSQCPIGTPKCFVAGTLVLVSSNTGDVVSKSIEDIKAGDMVWSRNELSGEQGFKPVETTFVRETDRLIHLSYHRASARTPGSARRGQKGGGSDDPDDAAEIVGTPEHPFWSLTRESWVAMDELQPGERLLLADGGEGVVEGVRTEYALLTGFGSLGTPTNNNGLFSVYNFKVQDWHTYHVAPAVDQPAVFVHNANCGFANLAPGELAGELARANAAGIKPLPFGSAGTAELVNQGAIKFVVTESGDLIVGPKAISATEELSHAVLSNGKPVLTAGEAEITSVGGKHFGIEISPHSGHFKPSADSLKLARDAFERYGVRFPEE